MYDVHIDPYSMDLATIIIEYIKLTHHILNTSLFIFINLKAYFSDDDLELLYQTIIYEKVNIILIERYETTKLNFEDRILIDNDACVIYDRY